MEIETYKQKIEQEGEGGLVYRIEVTFHNLSFVVKQEDIPVLEDARIAIMSPEPPEGREPESHEIAVAHMHSYERHGDEAYFKLYMIPDERLVHLVEIAKILEVSIQKANDRELCDAWYETQSVGKYAPPKSDESIEEVNVT